jgi:hypothetical protein
MSTRPNDYRTTREDLYHLIFDAIYEELHPDYDDFFYSTEGVERATQRLLRMFDRYPGMFEAWQNATGHLAAGASQRHDPTSCDGVWDAFLDTLAPFTTPEPMRVATQ